MEKEKELKAGAIRTVIQTVGFEVYDGKDWVPCEKEVEARMLSLLYRREVKEVETK